MTTESKPLLGGKRKQDLNGSWKSWTWKFVQERIFGKNSSTNAIDTWASKSVAQKENYSDAAEPNMGGATLETGSFAEDALEVDPSTFYPLARLRFPAGMTGIEERNYWIRNSWDPNSKDVTAEEREMMILKLGDDYDSLEALLTIVNDDRKRGGGGHYRSIKNPDWFKTFQSPAEAELFDRFGANKHAQPLIDMVNYEVERRTDDIILARSRGICCYENIRWAEHDRKYPEYKHFARPRCCEKGNPEPWELEWKCVDWRWW